MGQSHERDQSGRSPVESTIIGDPDDHDFAVFFEPSKPGCAVLTTLEAAVGVGGTLLLRNILPEGHKLTQHGFELLAIWGALPAVYALGIISWIAHTDLDHYDHRTHHGHPATTALKAPLYAARSLKDWGERKLNR